MDSLDEAMHCFIVDGLESELIAYLMDKPYMTTIIDTLDMFGISISMDNLEFDWLLHGMQTYCNEVEGK